MADRGLPQARPLSWSPQLKRDPEMRFFLKVELAEDDEVWRFYNESLEKVTELTGPTDSSVGRLVRAALLLDQETFGSPAEGAEGGDEVAQKAWLLFMLSAA